MPGRDGLAILLEENAVLLPIKTKSPVTMGMLTIFSSRPPFTLSKEILSLIGTADAPELEMDINDKSWHTTSTWLYA